MLYCSSECGSISIMHAQYTHNLLQHVYVYTFHVGLCLLALTFVCNYHLFIEMHISNTSIKHCSIKKLLFSALAFALFYEVQRNDSKQHDALKALSHGAIFLATCDAILLLRDTN